MRRVTTHRRRLAFNLSHQGMTFRELGERLNVSIGTARRILIQAHVDLGLPWAAHAMMIDPNGDVLPDHPFVGMHEQFKDPFAKERKRL